LTKRTFILAALLVGAAVLVVVGVIQGQPGQVLSKAINICLECVGLG
jgi:hypothetical protein